MPVILDGIRILYLEERTWRKYNIKPNENIKRFKINIVDIKTVFNKLQHNFKVKSNLLTRYSECNPEPMHPPIMCHDSEYLNHI